jgi:hypothetical protein
MMKKIKFYQRVPEPDDDDEDSDTTHVDPPGVP